MNQIHGNRDVAHQNMMVEPHHPEIAEVALIVQARLVHGRIQIEVRDASGRELETPEADSSPQTAHVREGDPVYPTGFYYPV